MILEAYMPVYIGVKIFIAYGCTGGRAGPPEVVQEALADLKKPRQNWSRDHFEATQKANFSILKPKFLVR
jgi:hypothetical protein